MSTRMAGEPACWSWTITDEHRKMVGRCPENYSHYLLWNWQHGRCAVCAVSVNERLILVRDHDHVTGLTRGLLCQTCNNTEGRTVLGTAEPSGLFDNYRMANPATMLSLRTRHVITSGPFGPPLPRRSIGDLYIPFRRPVGEAPLEQPRTSAAYGTWAEITGRGKLVEHSVFDLVGARFDSFDLIGLRDAYQREVTKALPEGISLHRINFFGPHPRPDDAAGRIKAAIDSIDLTTLVGRFNLRKSS